MMVIDWNASGCTPSLLFRWDTGEARFLKEYIFIVREHKHSTEQEFSFMLVTVCDSFTVALAIHQELQEFRRNAVPKVDTASEVPTPSVASSDAYDTDQV